MATVEAVLSDVISKVSANTRNPEAFLSVQNSAAAVFKEATKQLYDLTKSEISRKNNALPELVIDGFDEEQVWQQLELQNDSELSHFLGKISRILSTQGMNFLTLPVSPEVRKPEIKEKEESEESVKEDDLEDEGDKDENDDEDEDEEEDEDEDEDEDEENVSRKRPKFTEEFGTKRKGKSSVVDDKFFKLQDLEEYLTKEDKKERQDKINLESDEDSDDESVDLFNDISDEEDGGDGSSEEGKSLKYADFFDSPEDEDPEKGSKAELDEVSEEANEDSRKKKKVKFNLTNDSDDTDSLEKEEGDEKDSGEKMDIEVKSSLEARQERLRKRIEDMEEAAISEKPWQLKGEVSGLHRPQNSLLEEYVEFDVTSRPAPIITEQTTLKLEDIIKQRIKDKAWDDVEKKFKPVETPLEYKKKLVLDQEKSKESLAQIYENEYLKQKEALNPENAEREKEEPKEHIEIREMMGSLFRKLDALSNFHYTPKLAKPEIKVISNLPAISMEEVAPVATSDGALLAPEEIAKKPRGNPMGKSERTKTDMNRERRKRKIKQRAIQKAKEAKEKLAVSKVSKKKTKVQISPSMITKLSKDRNVSRMEETSEKAVKSSTAFFDRLQDQVKKQIAGKSVARKKNRLELSAVKLKL